MGEESTDPKVWKITDRGDVKGVNENFLCDKPPPYKCKWTDFKKPGAFGVAKWLYEGSRATLLKEEELDRELPVIETLRLDGFDPEETSNGIRVTWLGHATVLVQIGDKKILTDPVFSSKCGPKYKIQIGHSRYRKAPCSIYELGSRIAHIDAVIISHNHYDHLDSDSICQLATQFPSLRWFVPLGVKAFMESCKCNNVEELSWWKYCKLGDVQVTFVPAQHWSKRGLMDDNMTLWGGWCVTGPQGKFYFAGDTGYDDKLFKEIGDKLGPFDLAAIPIGAYCPRWFMSHHHIDPEEALKVHEDVKAKKSIGIHWGTFNLSSEPIMEPRNRIIELQLKKEIEELEKENIEELQIKNIEDWLNKLIKELPKEMPEEWLKKKIEELNVEEFKELRRKKIEDWMSNRIEEMWKEKIEEWLRKKIGELQEGEIKEKQNFEKWLNEMIEELPEENIENLQKEKPEEERKSDELLKKKTEKLHREKIEEWLRKIIEELKTDQIDKSQKERLEEWLKKKIEELHTEKTEESQESLEEWLRNKIEEMQKENVAEWLRKKSAEVLHREEIEVLQRTEIDEWLKEKLKELDVKKLTSLQTGFDFFTVSIGETKFIKNEKELESKPSNSPV